MSPWEVARREKRAFVKLTVNARFADNGPRVVLTCGEFSREQADRLVAFYMAMLEEP